MHPFLTALDRALLFYGTALPYHTGKSRIVEAIVKRCRLDRLYGQQSVIVRRRGITWKLTPDCIVQRSVYYCSCYEAKETRELEKLVRPDWTFFDVGSYFGYYSLLVSRLSGARATVHAFEPFRAHFELLLEHKRVNRFVNLHAHQLAISDRSGEVEFQIPSLSENRGGGRIIADAEQDIAPETTQTVRTISLDAFVAEHDIAKVDFIKVDAEGAEPNVLVGSADTIKKFRPTMMIEVNPDNLARYGRKPEELSQMLRDFEYTPYRVTRTGLERFDDFGSLTGEENSNVFCFPSRGTQANRSAPP